MEQDNNLDELRAALRADVESVARALLGEPNRRLSKRRSLRWGAKGSLAVEISGAKKGSWYSHEAGEGGDPFGLIRHVLRCDFPEAVEWARHHTGIAAPDTAVDDGWIRKWQAQAEERRARQAEEEAARAAEDEADETRRIAYARGLWDACIPLAGTTAEKYLTETRGIPAPSGGWPDAVRMHPGQFALILAGTNADGDVRCVQLVRLTCDATKIEPTETRLTKQSYGPVTDAPARLPGPAHGPLLLAEGPETGLSLWAATGYETHIAFGNVANFRPPLGRRVVVCRDDDRPWSPGDKLLRKTVHEWRASGVNVVVATPWPVRRGDKSDFNDCIKEGGAEAVRARIEAAIVPAAIERGMPRPEADAQLDAAVAGFFAEAAKWNPESESAPVTHAIRLTVGGGKTHVARKHAIAMLKDMRRKKDKRVVVLAVPTRKLGDEQVERFDQDVEQSIADAQEAGLRAAVWRGREAPIPADEHLPKTAERRTMCTEPARFKDALDALEPIQSTVCKRRIEGIFHLCPHFGTCAYQAQMQADVDLWIVPHTSLFHEKPAGIGKVAALIVDESFWQAGLLFTDITADSLRATDTTILENGISDAGAGQRLHFLRCRAADIITDQPDAPLSRAAFLARGFTHDMAAEARKLEWQRKLDSGVTPQTQDDVRKDAVRRVSKHNKMVWALWRFWTALRALLADDGPEHSGWAELGMKDTKSGPVRTIFLKGRRDIRKGWKAPTLITDATLDMALVRPFWPQAELVADIMIEAPHQRLTQVTDAKYSKQRLLADDDEDAEGKPRKAKRPDEKEIARRARNLRDLHARLAAIGRHHAPGRVLVVCQQAVEEALKGLSRLPPNIETEHHNNVAGKDIWRDVSALVVVGRTAPRPGDVEDLAEALTGAAANRLGKGEWYPRATVQRLMTTGQPMEAEADRHPDPAVEAVRRQICEGQLVQIIGRARGVNRTADNPVQVLVMTDVPLPLPVDAAVRAADLDPTPAELMLAAGGVAFESHTDAAEACPALWRTERAARRASDQRSRPFPYKEYLYGKGRHLCTWTYQRAGNGKRPSTALIDTTWHADPAAALAARLGPLAVCRPVEEERQEPAATPEPPAAPEPEPWPPAQTVAAFDTVRPDVVPWPEPDPPPVVDAAKLVLVPLPYMSLPQEESPPVHDDGDDFDRLWREHAQRTKDAAAAPTPPELPPMPYLWGDSTDEWRLEAWRERVRQAARPALPAAVEPIEGLFRVRTRDGLSAVIAIPRMPVEPAANDASALLQAAL